MTNEPLTNSQAIQSTQTERDKIAMLLDYYENRLAELDWRLAVLRGEPADDK